MFLQLILPAATNPYALPAISTGDFLSSIEFLIVLIGLATIAIGLIVLFTARALWRKVHEKKAAFAQVVLLVTVPKERKEDSVKGGPTESASIQKIREEVAVMETLFSTIGGLRAEKGWHAWLNGREDHFSFEIVVLQGLIHFFVATPKKYRQFIEEQIQAQFPAAVVEETEDYNIFSPTSTIMGAYLLFNRRNAFPIKTYKKIDSDPLNSITNTLTKVATTDGAAIQFIVRSSPGKWRREGIKLARAIQQGKKFERVAARGAFTNFLHEYVFTEKQKKKDDGTSEPYRLSPMEEEVVKGLEEKASRAGLDVNIRLISSAPDKERARQILDQMTSAFAQFNSYHYGNTLSVAVPSGQKNIIHDFIFRAFREDRQLLLNTEEMASVFHFPLSSTETPNIKWLTSRKAPPPQAMDKTGLLIGYNEYRGIKTEIRYAQKDRMRHLYEIGKSGTGKTTLMENMATQDMKNGEGLCIVDPHGDFIDAMLGRVPANRADDVILFDPGDVDRPMGLNMLEYDINRPTQKTQVVGEIMNIFDKLYDLKATGGPMFEQYMRNAMLLVMDDPESGSTLMEIPKVLADEDYRRYKLSKIKNPVVYDFWTKEAEKAGGEAALANMVPYITSKLNQFIANDIMRPIIGQQTSAFDFYDAMNTGKIILVKLNKAKIGDLNAYLLGLIFVSKILISALNRGDMNEKDRRPFYLYIDEFQNFITDSIATILSEARKYGLGLIVGHQYISQMVKNNDTKVRDAIFGNVGTMLCYRIGAEDSEYMSKEFAPTFSAFDLLNIEFAAAYVKLLIKGSPSKPFNMKTFPPPPQNIELAAAMKELSRLKYGRPRAIIEDEIRTRTQSLDFIA